VANEHATAFADCYPVTDGHTLVVTREHISSIYQLSTARQTALWDLVAEVRQSILNKVKPDGFNIGVNDDLAAGQTVEHAHVHVIPRYTRDVSDPRGGIRWIISEHAKYRE
jgi:diadenosine tetraphosphate (Ap4A) HIT family hydrolase